MSMRGRRIVPIGLVSRAVASVDQKRAALSVPYAIEHPDRARKERYYDADFFAMEAELLWPRVWQMACRLEEIPQPYDFVEYEILDQSIIVLRTDDMGVRAFQNSCRHRGVRVVEGRGTCENGFTCPFHGWCYGPDGKNTFVSRARTFSEHNLDPDDINLVPVQCETWGGCAWINLDNDAPPLRQSIEPFATIFDAWKVESLRTEWWYACRLPVNWKLAEAAFMEQYHVVETHPQLRIAGRYAPPDAATFDARAYIEADLKYLQTMSDGMAGHGARERRAHRRRSARHRTASRPEARDAGLGACAQRRGGAMASREGERHPRPQRSRSVRDGRADGLLLPASLRVADVQQRVLVSLPSAGTRRNADGDLVADPIPRRDRAGEAHASRAVGVRRSPLAAHPRAGFLEPAAPAEGTARPGIRVHAICPSGSKATSPTSSARSTATSPACPTTSCSRRCIRST